MPGIYRVLLLVAPLAALSAASFSARCHDVSTSGRIVSVPDAVLRMIARLRETDLPLQWRRRNWLGSRGEGSCVHASLVHLLHWQGRHAAADDWQSRYGNGETPDGLAHKLEASRLRWAETRAGDATFLEWALRTRRGAAVVVQNGAHMVNLVGFDDRRALILDSNVPDRIVAVPRQDFLHDWKQSGGWAVALVGTPPPPAPWIVKSTTNASDAGRSPARMRIFKTNPTHSL